MATLFEMSLSGDIHFLLGIQIIKNNIGGYMFFIQEKYFQGFFKCYNMEHCNSIITHLQANIKLSTIDYPQTKEVEIFMAKIPYS
jgi:hypothetical protein